jgi:hypothetical protein
MMIGIAKYKGKKIENYIPTPAVFQDGFVPNRFFSLTSFLFWFIRKAKKLWRSEDLKP